MLLLRLRAAGIGASLALAIAGSAHAQKRLVVTDDGIDCRPYDGCSGTCALPHDMCLSDICTATSADGRDYNCCHTESASDDCSGATCDPIGDTGFGVCSDRMDDRPRACGGDEITAACFDGASWENGDCDGDDLLNAADPEPCVCDPSSPCGMDAGGGGDSGMNVSGPDGGASELDAGPAPPAADDGWDYRGSGGCTCDAASSGGDVAWLAVGVAVALGARRRRRSRLATRRAEERRTTSR